MKTYTYMRFLLLLALIVAVATVSSGQEVESGYVGIQFNNMPDTEAPLIKVLSPVTRGDGTYMTETEEVNIIGEITDESQVKYASFDGELVSPNELGIFTLKVKLEPGINQFRITASDVEDNTGELDFFIEFEPPVVTLADRIRKESSYYGLIIGIDEYEDPELPDLSNPVKDAKKLFSSLVRNYTFKEENITLLRNCEQNEILRALDDMAGKVTPDDNVLIFFAGHGTWDEKADIGFWLPRDAYLNSTVNWFRNSTLVDYLKVIDSRHTLLITDACFAGSIFQDRSARRKEDRAFEILYEMNSRKAMTSGMLTAVPDRSSFTKFLIERLNENKELYLSSEQLYSSFRIAAINNSEAAPQYGEIRNVGDEGGDFIFLRKE